MRRASFGALWQRGLGGVGGWDLGWSLECSMSAPCARSEVLSGFEPGCMRVAHSWVTCKASNSGQQRCGTPALWRRWYRRPKQRNRWHSRAASVWDNLCGGEEGRRGRLTHLATEESAVATMGHAARGGRAGFEDRGPDGLCGWLLRLRGQQTRSRAGWKCAGWLRGTGLGPSLWRGRGRASSWRRCGGCVGEPRNACVWRGRAKDEGFV